ncbi:retrovirus-related Pol polyprotein from transposon TNT 1-94 [Cucumis melo var. makuwa]|uniref:Retrovirus-related Pol polyprotein from transposon TNT 1-94 n=1 Tax=Cucumis melo var. makuwa TaxID=1194695 RepID=A0A5A7TGL0_CUCMM|nr:retrovirus-related Pol polyprotein from transposon TNT 1-94 [Cucumis melo var. makuwa]TYK17782.1 retrovirus-related Pol polyprotein from transposon TNT 1-94 [Cucumis melo var. makuwa]
MQEELNQFERNKVWGLVPRPSNTSIIGTKWVLRNKLDENGNIIRNKTRPVAQGYCQDEGTDYEVTFALVARLEAIRMLLAFPSTTRISGSSNATSHSQEIRPLPMQKLESRELVKLKREQRIYEEEVEANEWRDNPLPSLLPLPSSSPASSLPVPPPLLSLLDPSFLGFTDRCSYNHY